MKARPIIMSAPMVRALLDGRKTQTRRVVKPQPVGHDRIIKHMDGWVAGMLRDSENAWRSVLCPYGQPGDLLWAREAWALPPSYDPKVHGELSSKPRIGPVCFKADYPSWTPWPGTHWCPSIHMPRWASRLTLELTAVSVERVREISCADAIAEGIRPAANSITIDCDTPDPRHEYRALWDSLNARRAPWESNPWVWVLTFKVHQRNVDNVLEKAA